MDYWIEVTSGMRWDRLLKDCVALEAPNTTRYRNFFKNLKAGDLVVHYLTSSLTPQREKKSSIVGMSLVTSDPAMVGRKITARCSNTLEFPKPVPYSELRTIRRKSVGLDRLLEFSMQRYLTQISKSDIESILSVHPANNRRFSKSRLAKQLQT